MTYPGGNTNNRRHRDELDRDRAELDAYRLARERFAPPTEAEVQEELARRKGVQPCGTEASGTKPESPRSSSGESRP